MIRLIAVVALVALPATASAQVDPGARLFVQCQACHSIRKGEPHKIGPNLFGVAGAPAASRPGYSYSKALVNARLVWTQETLDRWLTRPSALVSGNKMVFAGMADARQRQALIAYLWRARR